MLFVACTTLQTPTRIALLAPFEGRYREIGYEALYAARLALQDAGNNQFELLPIDDGGTVETAVDRARALAVDPQVKVTLVLGYAATDAQTLAAFDEMPVIVVGYWGVELEKKDVFILANPTAVNDYTISPRADVLEVAQIAGPIVGGEVLALKQIADLRTDLNSVTIATSMTLPDPAFTERYASSDPFAPEPGLFAPLTYTAMTGAINNSDFASPALAPIQRYIYNNNGELVMIDGVIE